MSHQEGMRLPSLACMVLFTVRDMISVFDRTEDGGGASSAGTGG